MQVLDREKLATLAFRAGLTVVGVADSEQLETDAERLRTWQQAGFAAEMQYMQRSPELLSSPAAILPGARSVVTVALFYDRAPVSPLPPDHGRVARYAWGRDYHKVLRRRLEQLVALVRSEQGLSSLEARVFSDSVPLLERALGRKSALGFVGKSTMLIMPGRGTFFFLGEIIWDVDVRGSGSRAEDRRMHCGSCQSCMSECPTQAFVGERVLDAGRCISYLSIEKRGVLSLQERRMLGEWIFGCDVCQEVCPFNVVPLKKKLSADVPELGREAGVGPSLPLAEVLGMRDGAAFERKFAGTALMRAKREGLLRNAAIVAANRGVLGLETELLEASRADSSAIVRRHALWAYSEILSLQGGKAKARMLKRLQEAQADPDSGVVTEAREILAQLPN